jgi:hypothetical protein
MGLVEVVSSGGEKGAGEGSRVTARRRLAVVAATVRHLFPRREPREDWTVKGIPGAVEISYVRAEESATALTRATSFGAG